MGGASRNVGKNEFKKTNGGLIPGDGDAEGGMKWAITEPVSDKGLYLVKPLDGKEGLKTKTVKRGGGVADRRGESAGEANGREKACRGPGVESFELGFRVVRVLKRVSDCWEENCGVKNLEVVG